MTVDALVAKSLSVFDEIANAVLDEWKFSQPEVTVPWFRGQRNATCPLLPKFHRLVCRDPGLKTDCESELREELQLRASLLVGARPRNDWAWYVLMQHNGAATRLLDWTEASHVALYFAVSQHADSCDHVDSSAAVFALDPYELNRCVLGESYVYPVGDPLASKRVQQITRPWLPSRFEGRLRRRETCAVSSPHLVPRMAVQRSCFTVAGSDSRWLERRGNQRFLPLSLIHISAPTSP